MKEGEEKREKRGGEGEEERKSKEVGKKLMTWIFEWLSVGWIAAQLRKISSRPAE